MGAVAAVARRGIPMPVFDDADPLDEVITKNVRFPKRMWLQLIAIAKLERAQGKKSPLTRRGVSKNDVLWSAADALVKAYVAEHGPLTLEEMGDDEEESAPAQVAKSKSPGRPRKK
ncbi:hypothetical protein OV208_15165 [Corallococcus sp. bb12-1]|uniref:hypothetical protein n=1 Tax=Corallococcus sp. bb12-1 TaxID=2996784 RepID=UPI00226DF15F|nr:hypothetical protein [Corallococcus sp. bb12-1]MCY1042664.1 hypothetical protein [Corallococcus sp. bb12-1]